MRIVAATIVAFELPCRSPLPVGGGRITHRAGHLLVLRDEAGNVAAGEAAPLPGWGGGQANRCLTDLRRWAARLTGAACDPAHFDLQAPLMGLFTPAAVIDADALFAVESALFFLAAGCAPHRRRLFGSAAAAAGVRVNGLFLPEEDTALQAARLRRSGVTTVKIKIGQLPPEVEIRRILELYDLLGADVSLRLDGNRRLAAADLHRYWRGLRDLPVEYVEEPLRDDSLSAIADVPWTLAADQLAGKYLDPARPDLKCLPQSCGAVVLKPTLFQGLHPLCRLLAAAAPDGPRIVLSSAWNTGITLTLLGILAAISPATAQTAHGLDTLGYFDADVVTESPAISGGRLRFPAWAESGRLRLNPEVVRPVAQ
ncbi:MAG: enolase C-terminal domain-like protein [Desulfobacterales bacterium]